MIDLLATLLEEAFAATAQARNGIDRQHCFPETDNMIKVAIGMRRSGKTYLLYQTINNLLDQGIPKSRILFVNFEDDRLLPMNTKEMGNLLDAFYQLYPENHHQKCHLFLDEVQNVPDWHLVIRRYFDSKNVQLYLTGSSAKLLSKEINTRLRGRSLAVEVLPYSFQEYLFAHDIKYPKLPFGQTSFDLMQQHLLHYFTTGGFPAVQSMPNHEWRQTLQSYVDTTILRDIIERHRVSNTTLLKYFTTTLLKNSSTPFSINKFYNDTKSQGYRISKDTLHNYLAYIQDAFLIFTVPLYSESERAQQNTPKKIYAIDNGLIHATSTHTQNAYGKLFENLIYLDLRRQKKDIYFYKTADHYEIDFITVDQHGNKELIQVAWDTTNTETRQREERALIQAQKELDLPGRIITAREYLKSFAS